MKKMILLALAAISAMLMLPALASATPAHLSKTPENFSVHSWSSYLSRVDGSVVTAAATNGSGAFENTTTGTVKLTFEGVQTQNPTTNCASTGEGHALIAGGGKATTTTLPFHLVMLSASRPGVLVTPAANNHFATFKCVGGLVTIVVKGVGILGEITSPLCGEASLFARVNFWGSNGVQSPAFHTGHKYTLETSINGGGFVQAAMSTEASITLLSATTPTLNCTS
jgi:hypothetical protein